MADPSSVLQGQEADDAEKAHAPVLVVSPHYDDAVFSCGDLLAARPGSTVLTVYAGMPEESDRSTDWDHRCGFSSAYEAMRARDAENRRALASLEANAVDLDFLDSQYLPTDSPGDAARLMDTLSRTLSQSQLVAVFAPLGLFHDDHIRCSDALMAISGAYRAMQWFVYEEIPYRAYHGLVQERLSWLLREGLTATPSDLHCAAGRKAVGVAAYRSQLTGLGPDSGRRLLQQPECYWRLNCRGE